VGQVRATSARIFNTNQAFTSPRSLGPLKAAEIQISMDGKGRAIDNVFIGRLWRTVKYERSDFYGLCK
jgi:putative transposase